MKYCFATAKIRTIFISSKFLEEKTQKDGILGEHGLIENAVLQVSFGFYIVTSTVCLPAE